MADSMRYAWRRVVVRDAHLTEATRRVLLELESYTDADGTNAHPGIQRIAESLATVGGTVGHMSDRTVRTALDIGCSRGFLELTAKAPRRRGNKQSTVYRLTIPDEFAAAVQTAGEMPLTPVVQTAAVTAEVAPAVQAATQTDSYTGHLDELDRQSEPLRPAIQTADHQSLYTRPSSPDLQKTPSPRAAKPADPAGFDEFWQTYPRRQGKGAAIKAYEKALRRADVEEILAAAHRYATDPNREDQFTAHPTTWLNQDRWLDDALPSRTPDRNGPMSASEKVAGWGAIAAQMTSEPQEPQWAIEAGA